MKPLLEGKLLSWINGCRRVDAELLLEILSATNSLKSFSPKSTSNLAKFFEVVNNLKSLGEEVQSNEESLKITEDLRTLTDWLQEEKSATGKELEALKAELSITKQQLESAEQQVAVCVRNMKVTKEENESLTLKLSEISNDLEQAQNTFDGLISESGNEETNEDHAEQQIEVMHDGVVEEGTIERTQLNTSEYGMSEIEENRGNNEDSSTSSEVAALTLVKLKTLEDIYARCNLSITEPESYTEAAENVAWQDAVKAKLDMIEKNNTWGLVNRPADKPVKWMFKTNLDYG